MPPRRKAIVAQNTAETALEKSRKQLAASFFQLSVADAKIGRVNSEIRNLRLACEFAPPIRCGWIKSAYLVDMSRFRQVASTHFDGLIGMDALSNFIVHIDFDNGVVTLIDGKSTERPPGFEVRLGPAVKSVMPVPVSIGIRKPEYFLVDTGADAAIQAAPALFQQLKADPNISPTGVASLLTDTFGKSASLEQLSCKDTLLGIHHVDNVVVSQGEMNVVGMRYLCRYRVTFDFPRSKSYWAPSERFSCRDNGDYCGVVYSAGSDGGWFVSAVVKGSPADAAGIKVGDEIVEVDSIRASTAADAMWLRCLRFPRLKPIRLSVKRDGAASEFVIATETAAPSP